jgi:hypothetical protein
MWSLRQRNDGSFYLTFDKFRRFTHTVPGLWEFVGSQIHVDTPRLVEMNRACGYECVEDDEGGVRALVLTEGETYV